MPDTFSEIASAATTKPIVLLLSGHDPSGGAGIQADIEAVVANQCAAASVITLLTTQNSAEFSGYYSQELAQFKQQTEMILADYTISAIKIGAIGSSVIASAIGDLLLKGFRDAGCCPPVVLDPVICTSTGSMLCDQETRRVLVDSVLPAATLVTPNRAELEALTGQSDVTVGARMLNARGPAVLVTGLIEHGMAVNWLYTRKSMISFRQEHLEFSFHGSGCTLASAVAAKLAGGLALGEAVADATNYTWQTLRFSMALGRGGRIPNRFYAYDGSC